MTTLRQLSYLVALADARSFRRAADAVHIAQPTLSQQVRALEARLGVTLVERLPHVLRHTCASRLVQGGIDIRRVQTWLGHQTLQMTMRYAHLASQDLDSCVPVLEIMARKSARISR